MFFPCQCCRSSWWCRPCFGGLECWRWWWFDPPRRQAGPFVAWPVPPRGRSPVLQTQKRQKPFVPRGSSSRPKLQNPRWPTKSFIYGNGKILLFPTFNTAFNLSRFSRIHFTDLHSHHDWLGLVRWRSRVSLNSNNLVLVFFSELNITHWDKTSK